MKLFAFGNGRANDYRHELYWAGAITLAVLAVDYPVVGFDFLNYDDPINVSQNPLITNFSRESLQRFWGGSFRGLYIPLAYTVWGLLASLAQLLSGSAGAISPLPFHLANLGLHLASTLLVFRLLRGLGSKPEPAAIGALLFALHPLQIEAVAWVTGLKDLLSGFLALLAIHYYLSHLQTNRAERDEAKGWRDYRLACGFFLLALLAKPSAITMPLLAGALGYFCIKRPFRKLARELLPMLALALPLAWVTIAAQSGEKFPLILSFWQRTLVAADALNFYAGKLFWPAALAPDYGRMPLAALGNPRVFITLLTPLLLGVVIYLGRRKNWNWLPAGLLIFILALLPVLGFLPFTFQKISTVADRYLYLAMLGPALLVARGWELMPQRMARLASLLLLAGLAIGSTLQVRAWKDSFTLNRLTIEVNPASTTAYNNLGAAHEQAGNLQEAQKAYRQAIAIAPFAPDAYHNLGSLNAKAGFHQEALDNFAKALPLAPRSSAHIQLHLGDEHKALGNYPAARNFYQQALDNGHREQLDPAETAITYASLGSLLGDSGYPGEAITTFRQALALNPNFSEAYSNLGVIYGSIGDQTAAEKCYRQAIALDPNQVESYNNLGLLLTSTNHYQEAVAILSKATTLAPSHPVPLENLAKVYRLAGRPDLAAEYAARARALLPR